MTRRFRVGLLVVLVLFLSYLAYLVTVPFFVPLTWAAVFAIVFYPVYRFILRHLPRPWIAALATSAIVLVAILGPLSYLSFLLVGEVQDLAGAGLTMEGVGALYHQSIIHDLANRVLPLFHLDEKQALAHLVNGLTNLSKQILHHLPAGLGNVMAALMNFFIMAFALFFLFKDGDAYVATIFEYLPFSERHKQSLSKQAKDIIVSTIYGGVVVGLAQGVVGSIGYVAVGVPTPLLWGLATAITSFIPFVGSHIVWVPMSIYFLATGHVWKAAILAAVGVFGIGLVDNIVRPFFIRGRAKMSFLLTFIAVFGGIQAFGLLGIIVGPLILALYFSLLAIVKDVDDQG